MGIALAVEAQPDGRQRLQSRPVDRLTTVVAAAVGAVVDLGEGPIDIFDRRSGQLDDRTITVSRNPRAVTFSRLVVELHLVGPGDLGEAGQLRLAFLPLGLAAQPGALEQLPLSVEKRTGDVHRAALSVQIVEPW
jgi:hypothetical protein